MYNICFFSAQYLPHMGGVENYTYCLSKELIKNGNNVTVVTSFVDGLKTHEIEEEIEIYRLPSLNLMDGRLPILKLNKQCKKILSEIKSKNFDIIIINTRFYLLSLVGARFAYKNNIPAIMIEHGTGHLQFNNKFMSICENIYEHFITYCDKKYIHSFYGVSNACNEWLKHFKILAKGTIYNAIDPEMIKNEMIITTYYTNQYMLDNKLKFCFVGRLIKEKGIDKLITAFKKIENRYPNVCLLIAGDGPLIEFVKKNTSDSIIYLGRLSRNHVLELLLECDVFCLPSLSEGFSTAVLEAGLCKAYIITTKQGGSKELIKNKNYGSIIDNNDISLIYDELVRIVNKSINIEECTRNTYHEIISNFTWERTSIKLLQIIGNEIKMHKN